MSLIGPSAHLFHSVHEQNYVAHVIIYAADLGNYYTSGSGQNAISNIFFYFCLLLLTFTLLTITIFTVHR